MKKLWLLCIMFFFGFFIIGCQKLPKVEDVLLKLSIDESLIYHAEGVFFVTRDDESEFETKISQYTSLQDEKSKFIVDRLITLNTQTRRVDTTYIDDSGHYVLQTFYDFNASMNDFVKGNEIYEYVSKERLDNMPVVLPPILPLLQPHFEDIDLSLLELSIRKSGKGFVIEIETDFKTLVDIDPELRFLYFNDDDLLRYDITVDKNYVITQIHLYATNPLLKDTTEMSQFSIKVSFLKSSYDFPTEAELSEHRSFAGYPDVT